MGYRRAEGEFSLPNLLSHGAHQTEKDGVQRAEMVEIAFHG